jgi:hypothetical protein
MPKTFTKISSTTVGSGGASSVTLSSIPSTYTDLCLKYSIRNTSTNPTVVALINGSSSNFLRTYIVGSGTSINSAVNDASNYIGYSTVSTDTSNTFANNELYITNYAGSTFKPFMVDNATENNATTAYSYLGGSIWSSTSAITSIDISVFGGNLAQYSTFTLYGIKNS